MVNRYCVHVRKSGAGSRPPDRERSEGKLHSRRRRSLFRHAGLAQPGEIGGFEEGLGLRLPGKCGSQARDTRITIVAAQPPGLGEFGGGAFALTLESVGRSKRGAGSRTFPWVCATRLFEPESRLVDARLHQMRSPNRPIPRPDVGITGTEPDGFFEER